MLFNSIAFLIFFPIVLLLYHAMPKKLKNPWLLAASYWFYMGWNAAYALLILGSTVVTYTAGLWIEKAKTQEHAEGKKKRIVAVSLILNLGVLFIFKYLNFTMDLTGSIAGLLGVTLAVPKFDLVLPVGISFYTFQALGYTIDVYRNDIHAEKNFIQYALFVSFFPQLVAGPIERSGNLLSQLAVPRKFDFDKARDGLLLMLWGYFLKVVLADRIAIFVDAVYGNYVQYAGWYLIVATVLFAVQIYCDFAGYSTIALGAAEILGVKLTDNFNAPYLAVNVSQFWRNWHISLTSWFKDYVYIPLGGNRKGKARKYLNKMIVFLLSGLWHGAGLTYVIWGGLNGLYQVIGEILLPVRKKLAALFGVKTESVGHKLFCILFTFVLVDFSWIFFRASTLQDAGNIIASIANAKNIWVLFDRSSLYRCGLDAYNFRLMLLCIGLLLFADICKVRGIRIRQVIAEQNVWYRWLVIVAAVCGILLFGIWGPGYNAQNFIYFQF